MSKERRDEEMRRGGWRERWREGVEREVEREEGVRGLTGITHD